MGATGVLALVGVSVGAAGASVAAGVDGGVLLDTIGVDVITCVSIAAVGALVAPGVSVGTTDESMALPPHAIASTSSIASRYVATEERERRRRKAGTATLE